MSHYYFISIDGILFPRILVTEKVIGGYQARAEAKKLSDPELL